MLERFRRNGHAVLFGTRSFWQGVGIPGEALSMVILDKIPFQFPTDPVMERQWERVKAAGRNPFVDLQLGPAIIILRQGAGRLIRSETDRGVIALLDTRTRTRRYGYRIRASLPEGRHTPYIQAVRGFFAD